MPHGITITQIQKANRIDRGPLSQLRQQANRIGRSSLSQLSQRAPLLQERRLESEFLNVSNFAQLEEQFGADLAGEALRAFTDPELEVFGEQLKVGRFEQGVQIADVTAFLEDPRFVAGELGSKGRGRLAEIITQERVIKGRVEERATEEAAELLSEQSRASERLIRIQTQQQRRQQAGGLRSGVLTSPRGLSGSTLRLG